MSTDPLTRVARQRHLIARLGLAVAFEGLLILALLIYFLADRQSSAIVGCAVPVQAEEPNTFEKTFTYAPEPGKPDGQQIFEAKCNSCHRADGEPGTGPGLAGALDRIPKGDWKYKWVRNSQALIDAGDPYANAIYIKYNKNAMTPQNLSDEEIDAVFHYIEAYKNR